MPTRWPQVLRRGAVVRVASSPTQGPGPGAHALSYVDLHYKDGPVERWLGPGSVRTCERGLDVPVVLVRWGREVAEEQLYSLQRELKDAFYGIRPDDVDGAPVEIVIEWAHSDLP